MSGFDNFYGSNNYDGSRNTQTIIKTKEVVCHSESVEIIQQKLAIIQETVKRIITEQICDVETQTIILNQHQSSMSSFSKDLYRQSGKYVGYDYGVASRYGSIYNSDGSLSTSNLGFSGSSVGSQYVNVGGNNWNGQTSPNSVQNSLRAASQALSQS